MIIAVIGSRHFSDYKLLESTLGSLPEITRIVSGGAKGADSLAERYARQHRIPLVVFSADWKKYGRSAGIARNREIIGAAEMVVAFWDGKSKGTASSLEFARAKGIPARPIMFGENG